MFYSIVGDLLGYGDSVPTEQLYCFVTKQMPDGKIKVIIVLLLLLLMSKGLSLQYNIV